MSRDLIRECPEARQFVDSASRSWAKFKRYPTEDFVSVRSAVLATSAVDLQNECLAAEGLYEMARHIQQNSMWLMVEHNPLIPPIGRVLAARCFSSPDPQLHFVAGVIGLYDGSRSQDFSSLGFDVENPPFPEADGEVLQDVTNERLRIAYNPHEIPSCEIDKMLEDAPSEVDREPQLQARKSADPLTILTLSTSIAALLGHLGKKFSERLAERAADRSVDLSSWVREKVFEPFSRLGKEALFEFECEEGHCRVEFVVPSRDRNVLAAALEALPDVATKARALVAGIRQFGPEKLVYRFDPKSRRWFPLYAATISRGVIRNERALVAIEYLQFKKTQDVSSGLTDLRARIDD